MKKFLFLAVIFCSITSQNAMPFANNLASTNLELFCTTSANLTGLTVVSSQTLTGTDDRGIAVTVNCSVIKITIGSQVYFSFSTAANLVNVTIDTAQQFVFTDPVTGSSQTHNFIIEDLIIH